jgi:hypothetical protein
MSVACRGRIPAIILSICAASFAGGSFARAMDAQEAPSMVLNCSLSEPSSDDLLNNDHGSGTIDVQWILQDQRQLLSQGLSIEQAPLSSEPIRTIKLNTAPTPTLPHVDVPVTTNNPLDANDRLVPVPVLSLKWAIVLCAVLFHIGARVLRVRRSAGA